MKILWFFICSIVIQATLSAPKKKPKLLVDEEVESQENKSNYLVDLMEKAINSHEDISISTVRKPSVPLVTPRNVTKIKKIKSVKSPKKQKAPKKAIQKKIKKKHRRSHASPFEAKTTDIIGNKIQIGGSEEDETVEELGRRDDSKKKKFEDVYLYENEPLSKMLLWLIMNSKNPSTKNVIEASKGAVDKYVKYTVDKAGAQAAIRYTDYSSMRFDKDRIVFYCGGQLYVYNTLQDSKICFNGQIYEVRLV